jgi:hypothetical protein
MNKLTQKELDKVLERFNRCFDAVVESVTISYEAGKKYPNVNLSIQTQDEESEDGWSSLKLNLLHVQHFKYGEGKVSYRILSDGLILKAFKSGLWGVGFDENQDDEESDENFVEVAVGFVAEEITWEVAS